MKTFISFRGYEVEHRINRRMKNCYITIERQGKVLLKTPGISKARCLELLERRWAWIEQKLALCSEKPAIALGREALFMGTVHRLEEETLPELSQALGRLQKESPEHLSACYDRFYALRAKEHLDERVEHFSQIMGLRCASLRFRKMKRRWGSCSSDRVITFNTYLMQAAPELIDYVVVHELAHLKHMNHSPAFHALVRAYIPDEKERRARLRKVETVPFAL